MATLILNRIQPFIEPLLRKQQSGFRPGRSCVDQINTLRIIIEQSLEWRSPAYLLFIDFERAFDKVSRNAIWEALKRFNVPDHIISLICELYNGAECCVRFKGHNSEKFQNTSGVRQGCVLSPLLFLVILDAVMDKLDRSVELGIQWRPFEKLGDLNYADDMCFITHNFQDKKDKFEKLSAIANSVGLKINLKKTKLMRIGTTNKDPFSVTINSTQHVIEDVESFCYLGSIVSIDGGTEQDIKTRISKARVAFYKLNKVWHNRNISRKLKLSLFSSCVKSVLLYSSETWKVTDKIMGQLQTFINSCLRRICRIFWPYTISNIDLWQLTSSKEISKEILERKWRWIGHTLRKPADDIARMAFEYDPQGSRQRGRPRMTWRRSIILESKKFGTWKQIKKMAQDRTQWKNFVSALCSG